MFMKDIQWKLLFVWRKEGDEEGIRVDIIYNVYKEREGEREIFSSLGVALED